MHYVAFLNNGTKQDYDVVSTAFRVADIERRELDYTYLEVRKDGGAGNNLTFMAMGSETRKDFFKVNVVKGVGRSNIFGPRLVIHEIDRVLMFPYLDKNNKVSKYAVALPDPSTTAAHPGYVDKVKELLGLD